MKVIIFSGAGLSAPSGLPTYEELKLDDRYSDFFSSSSEAAFDIISDFVGQFSHAKPNKAHRECLNIEQFCRVFGIKFEHFTLNIDSLVESTGGAVTHLHGCVDDLNNLVENRFKTFDPFEQMIWEPGDILLVLGVSNDGYPLAFLEQMVTQSGASFRNYNMFPNDVLIGPQVVGDITQTLSAIDALNLLDLKCLFEIFPFDGYEADIVKFFMYGREYVVYFSPTLDFYTSPDEVDAVEAYIKHKLTKKSSEIKFDLTVNSERIGESFTAPQDKFTLKQLNMFGTVLVTIIGAHAKFREPDLYTASAIRPELVPFYNRLALRCAARLEYSHWCAFGKDGVTYAFKKQ
ncbi:hypothetical protein G3495_18885 [Shewanella baltica]|uniref:hypothetical protein n=1 Tax=Shewanella baltica TaxID=62322 RepID=UPI00217D85E6|nr:hypothetical protein [Shewanella baltica]MCS6237157.1 hypothetical protein [Shewanella baltica]MCS6272342.1 hypothetical protein [Shewanella baltica]